jgi:hypothetical protein
MCPDRQILSVYLDGELPSPWKEKMESHLASCPRCRETVETWKRISGEMRAGEEPCPQERVWERIRGRVKDAEGPKRFFAGEESFPAPSPAGLSGRSLGALWRRRVVLPFPAAAAAAAAVLVFVIGSIFFRPPAQSPIPDLAVGFLETAGIDMELDTIRPVNDVSGVLQYLESMDSDDIVIIRLPESRNFRSAGEPKMLRAADYSPGRSGQ